MEMPLSSAVTDLESFKTSNISGLRSLQSIDRNAFPNQKSQFLKKKKLDQKREKVRCLDFSEEQTNLTTNSTAFEQIVITVNCYSNFKRKGLDQKRGKKGRCLDFSEKQTNLTSNSAAFEQIVITVN